MTAPDVRFGQVVAGSLLMHALLLTALLLLPSGGGPAQTVPIYTVKIVEAPSVPEARALDLSPTLRRELNLQAPSFSTAAAPLPTAPAPDVTGLEAPSLPSSVAPLTVSPGKALPAAPQATAPAPPSSRALPTPPSLPQPPSAKPSRAAPGAAPSAPSVTSALPAAPAAPSAPEAPSLEDRLRAKVRSLNLNVESAEPESPSDQPAAERDKSLINLRLFQNTVRERVKKSYTFPGTFSGDLRARVRLVLERSGKLRSAEVVESSGNDRFDKLVCLAAIRNAKYPPLPDGVEGDTHTLFLTCSP